MPAAVPDPQSNRKVIQPSLASCIPVFLYSCMLALQTPGLRTLAMSEVGSWAVTRLEPPRRTLSA